MPDARTTEHIDQLLAEGSPAEVLQKILDQIEEVFLVVDRRWRFLYLNSKAQEILGCLDSEFHGQSIAEGLADHGGKALQEDLREAAESGDTVRFRHDSSGRTFMIKVHEWESGYTVCALDTTREEAARAEQTETERRLGVLAASVQDALWIYDQDARSYLYLSPAFEMLTGHAPEPFLSGEREFDELVLSEDREHVRDVREGLQDGVGEQLFRIMHPEKGVRWWRARLYPYRNGEDREGHLIAGVTRDVTEEMNTAIELRKVREQLEATVDERSRSLDAEIEGHRSTEAELRRVHFQLLEAQKLAGIGSFDWRIPEDRLEMSEELCRILGMSATNPPRSYEEFVEAMRPEDRPVIERLADTLRESRHTTDWEETLHRPEGEARIISGRVRLQRSPDQLPLRMFGVAQDVTELRRNQRKLEELGREARRLSQRLLVSQEQERRRIARELHDELGQRLTAVKLELERLAVTDAKGSPELVRRSIAGLENIMQEVRNLSLDLRPAALDDLGLGPALRWFLDRQAKLFDGKMDFKKSGLDHRLPDNVEITCFRVVQEAVTNALKHARADRISVEVSIGDEELEATIEDNGRGFDHDSAEDTARKGGTFGILGMRERASLSGGEVRVRTAMGQGTRIMLRLPLDVDRRE